MGRHNCLALLEEKGGRGVMSNSESLFLQFLERFLS